MSFPALLAKFAIFGGFIITPDFLFMRCGCLSKLAIGIEIVYQMLLQDWPKTRQFYIVMVLTRVSRLITAVCPSSRTDIWSPFVVRVTASFP